MIIRTRPRRIAFLAAFHAIAWGASAYFLYSAENGDRGHIARREAKLKMQDVSERIGELKSEKAAWERRVGQLSGDKVDRDLLDERLRTMVNLAHKNDVVILIER